MFHPIVDFTDELWPLAIPLYTSKKYRLFLSIKQYFVITKSE
jgi:hypothetical protein